MSTKTPCIALNVASFVFALYTADYVHHPLADVPGPDAVWVMPQNASLSSHAALETALFKKLAVVPPPEQTSGLSL